MVEPTKSSPTSCCNPPPDPRIARRFDERASQWTDADEFPSMVDVSTRLLEASRDATRLHPTVLELGCGTGALSVALLELGAARVAGLDLSPASIDVARRRAAARGFAERATFSVGNAVTDAVEPHDWVILDRSICCFPDVGRLVGAAISTARARIAISVPESRGWRGLLNRPSWAAENAWDLLHRGCRGYVHDLRRVEARLARAGFRPVPDRSSHVGLWFVGVYER